MKVKLVSIIAISAILVSMVGIAAASPYNLALLGNTNPIKLAPGQTVTLDVRADTFDSSTPLPHTILLTTLPILDTCAPTPCSTSDITITTTGPFSATTDPFIEPGAVSITLSATPSSPIGTKYSVHVGSADVSVTPVEVAIASRTVLSVPEFPTIAAPIAGVIGLVFFYQHRKKNKKE